MSDNVLEKHIVGVKGIGKQKALKFAEMGINTLEDLFNYFPYRYDDFRIKDLTVANHGDKVTVEGEIYTEPLVKRLSNKRNLISVKVVVDSLIITATWFNRMFLKNQLKRGRKILLTGKWDKNRLQITVAESEFLDNSTNSKKGNLLPVYSLPQDFKQNGFRNIMNNALIQCYHSIDDFLPMDIIQKYKLYNLRDAYRGIHFPKDYQDGKLARRRLVYDELLLYQLRLQIYKMNNRQNWPGIARKIDREKINIFVESLPFKLTEAQIRVLDEILFDMEKDYAMNRLLQGDVGSGKTVVAAVALYANYLSGFQGALMVPTEILAEQHLESLRTLLAPLGLEIALLTGKLTTSNRKNVLAQLQMGIVDIVVGTHALIQEDVYFKNLGLVITDEQHRFGVEQRAILRRKGNDKTPDVLFMTATPIPRTLAITAFGDMDVSTIDELPLGRKKIETYWVKPDAFSRVLEFIDKQINLGRQAYVICPLIEESDKLDVQNAIDIHALLSDHFPNFRVGLLHGRLSSKEKDEVMTQFKDNKINILVSTTVVEVGVNVPNATVMVIYDAERFGLAQLHQLRGRVGRGSNQSYCILLADPKSEIGKERMRVMVETNDGFEIARRDLKLRGPGDLFGVKQSGVPDFKLADLINDYRTLEVARSDAEKWVISGELWKNSKWNKLLKKLKQLGVFEKQTIDG
ncbi:ATP-dependent DNA helicase RecG [Vulcanibacillus modesticaldus]|uniref:ATP-dependent DNA helicase RecG n=1 Tax=Vulcanibacillus modesticaldus TaxID=337097 RepID=A0A1D2YX93_9BACI|nr:ATP-dependent DNA helicase RecG [Vulcanibacillus modesticaldus]OEG00344.1 ATP-dependent DNA helicase RecG [Vulcanibacillus modesticaldus]